MSTSLFAAALSTWRAVHASASDRKAAREVGGAIVKLSIKTVAGARTAENLGAEREGTGVVIDASGVILTIGYLILESESILVVTGDGRIFPAHVIGFDHATGFGLLRAAPGVAERPLELGDSGAVRELNAVRVAAHSAADGVSNACVVARRRFTGWWEYMLEDAIFTAPPRYDHSGAALIDESGKLVGIASLWVSDALDLGVAFPGNMFVPVDLLKPVYDDLVSTGRRRAPPRPPPPIPEPIPGPRPMPGPSSILPRSAGGSSGNVTPRSRARAFMRSWCSARTRSRSCSVLALRIRSRYCSRSRSVIIWEP